MVQVVSRRPLTSEPRIRVRVNACGICGGQSGTGTGFSPSSSGFSCQYYSTVVLHTHISSGEWTVCPLVAAVQRVVSLHRNLQPTIFLESTNFVCFRRHTTSKLFAATLIRPACFTWACNFVADHAMGQAVSLWPLTAENRVSSQGSPRGTCIGQNITGTGFPSSSSVFPCQYYCTMAVHTHITWRINKMHVAGRSSETQSHPIDMKSNTTNFV
jgi:hypothetical protein